jgi:CheY-like chemotaxis protein
LKKILVIDDDNLVRDTLVRILVRAGYEAIPAKDGREGITQFRKDPPDLILTDVIMPDQDGIETIVELRQLAPALPIIAISGGGRAKAMQFLDAAHKLGADKVLSKPVKQADLLAAIHELLTRASEKKLA